MNDTVRIFVGCDPNNCDLEQMMVLEYSLRKQASLPIEINWMQLSRDPENFWYANPEKGEGWRTDNWTTPFSGFRWAIPSHCNYEGRAIYMDADVLILCDIAELWRLPFEPGKTVMAKGGKDSWRFCVSVWDCATAKAQLPPLEQLVSDPKSHHKLRDHFKAHPELIQNFDEHYNNIDGENCPIEQIKILHYSDIGTQLTHKYSFERLKNEGSGHWFDGEVFEHPRKDLIELFDRYYQEALANGYSLENYRVKPFGDFPKASQKNYKGNEVTRAKGWRKFFSR